MRQVFLGAVCAILAGAAQAQVVCTFQSECFEQDGCMDSGFGLTVVAQTDETVIFETEFGDLDVVYIEDNVTQVIALARGTSGTYLLSNAPEGARLSVHLPGPIAVNYIGQCEGAL